MKHHSLLAAMAAVALSGAPLPLCPFEAVAAPAAADPMQELISAEALRADFRDLYAILQGAHRNLYARVPEREYDKLFADMLKEIRAPETRSQAADRFQRFVAFGKIAHARIDMAGAAYRKHRAAGGAEFPIGIRVVGEKVYVHRNRSGVSDAAPGTEILSLNGVPIAEWLRRTSSHVSADTLYMANTLMEMWFPRLLWLELGSVGEFAVGIRTQGGQERMVTIPARNQAEMAAAATLQQPLLELDWEERSYRMLDGQLAYLRPGPFYNGEAGAGDMYDNRVFNAFIDKAFTSFLSAGATSLLIDLRDNPGGDNSFSDYMVAWFATRPFRFASSVQMKVSPQTTASNHKRLAVPGNDPTGITAMMDRTFRASRNGAIIAFENPFVAPRTGPVFRGRVYALVNRHTWSNATTVAAQIQDYGFATIMGEETADLATTHGGMESFTLPRTGIEVGYPKSLIVRPSGSLAGRGVIPNVRIATPIVEPVDDPVLGIARALAGAQGR